MLRYKRNNEYGPKSNPCRNICMKLTDKRATFKCKKQKGLDKKLLFIINDNDFYSLARSLLVTHCNRVNASFLEFDAFSSFFCFPKDFIFCITGLIMGYYSPYFYDIEVHTIQNDKESNFIYT